MDALRFASAELVEQCYEQPCIQCVGDMESADTRYPVSPEGELGQRFTIVDGQRAYGLTLLISAADNKGPRRRRTSWGQRDGIHSH